MLVRTKVIGAGDGNRTHDIQLGKHSKAELKQEVKIKTSLQNHIFIVQVKNRLRTDINVWSQVGKAWAETASIHGFEVRATPVPRQPMQQNFFDKIKRFTWSDVEFWKWLQLVWIEASEHHGYYVEAYSAPLKPEFLDVLSRMEADELYWAEVGKALMETALSEFIRVGFSVEEPSDLIDLKDELTDPEAWLRVYSAWLDSGHIISNDGEAS